MDRKLALGIAIGVLVLAILACGPTSPTAAPTSAPQPTSAPRPTAAPTQDTGGGGGEEGGGKGGPAEPSPTPPGAGESGGGKGGGGSTDRPATLTLVNNSSSSVCYVYISPSTESSWGDDWLGASETVSSGDSRDFEVTAGTYDLRADDCDHNMLDERYSVSLTGSLSWAITGEAVGAVSVTLFNNSGQTVCYVYISPSTSSEWGDDWLGADVVGDGNSYTFDVAAGTYDFKAEDCDHNAMDTQFGIALSGDWDWTINPTGGSATLTVINNTDTAVWYVYISPSTSSEWGDDLLGSSTIQPGDSYTFNVTEGTYDLKAEDENHNVMATRFEEYISGDLEWTLSTEGGGSASLTLVNNSSDTVCYVYISPSTSSDWGADWLGASETLSTGDSRTFSLEAGTYDLKAEDCSHNEIASEFQQNISGDITWTLQ
jgi:hypothetical protein